MLLKYEMETFVTKRPPVVRVRLTLEEVRALQQLAHVYDKSAAPIRFLVRSTSSREMRSKFSFVAEESAILEQLARSIRLEMEEAGEESREVELMLRALIAFWGRVLAALDNKRILRKLSEPEIEARRQLATKLEDAARTAARRSRAELEGEIKSRRPVEAERMRERLGFEGA
jgi:hypothetical protein